MESNCLSVELPELLRGYVQERVARGEYASEADFLLDLIRRDREAHAAKRLRELIQEGLESGPARPMTEADWSDLRARATQTVA
jgi:antitoxin ParD1/3/4